MLRGPEEIYATQKSDKQRRIAEGGKRATDISDQNDKEEHDVGVVLPRLVGPDQRPDQNHGRAGGADDARNRRAER